LPRDAPTTPFFFSSSLSEVSAASALRAFERLRGLVVLVLHEQPDAIADRLLERRIPSQRRRRQRPRILSRASNTSAMVNGHMTASLYRNLRFLFAQVRFPDFR